MTKILPNNSLLFSKIYEKSNELATLKHHQRKISLQNMADALHKSRKEIIEANKKDCSLALNKIPAVLYERLTLSEPKLEEAISGIQKLIKLSDPLGKIYRQRNYNG